MDPQLKNVKDSVDQSESPAWQPEVLDGEHTASLQDSDFEISELWNWYHARLKLLGEIGNSQARLLALLNWRATSVKAAVHAARLEVNKMPGDDAAKQAHLEYLAAEYLAREALDLASVPRIEPHSA